MLDCHPRQDGALLRFPSPQIGCTTPSCVLARVVAYLGTTRDRAPCLTWRALVRRVELSLRERGRQLQLADLAEGQTLRGQVKRLERFGVFIALAEAPGLAGLAHISEVADAKVDDLGKLFRVGQGARPGTSLRFSGFQGFRV